MFRHENQFRDIKQEQRVFGTKTSFAAQGDQGRFQMIVVYLNDTR